MVMFGYVWLSVVKIDDGVAHRSRAGIKYQPKNDYMETWTFFTYDDSYFLPGYHITLYHVSASQSRPRFSQLDFRSALSKFP